MHRPGKARPSGFPTPLVWALLAWSLTGCGGSAGAAFAQHRAAAERAYAAGRYAESARHWHDAARSTEQQSLRRKARYREAVSALKAGESVRAQQLLARLAAEQSPLRERARYDLALLRLDGGDRKGGRELLRELFISAPNAAISLVALRHYRQLLEDESLNAALAAANELLPRLQQTPLAEPLRYWRAQCLEALQQDAAALAAYLELADRHPYPRGVHWDDALWRAALLEERAGHPQAAAAHLQRMLREQESADFAGSYERFRYAEARFHLAELLRDRLHDLARAEREFVLLNDRHPTSRLRDDALWEAAKLRDHAGDHAGACALLRTLRSELPQSRYSACAPLLCETLEAPSQGHCASYIERTLRAEPAHDQ